MNQKLIRFILLIFIFKSVYSLDKDELFGDKSIIRKLRNDLGSFKTEIKMLAEDRRDYSIEEQYSFKSKNGKIQNTFFIEGVWSWQNDFESFYNNDTYFETCSTLINDNLMKSYLNYWISSTTIEIPSKFKMLGPSYLLFFIIDHYDNDKESVKCENIENNRMIRCDIIFDDKAKLEYYFKAKDNMYPIKIKSFLNIIDKFGLYREFQYTKFDYSFNGDDYNVDFKMPIGIGCENEDKNNKYPKEETEFGEQLKIEYDAELEYLDLKTENEAVYFKTQFKLQKLFIDTNFSFSILDRIDEETNKNIRTYFDAVTKLAYDVYDDKCIKRNLKDGFKQSWINTLYDIKYLPDFFFANSKRGISYLGTSKLENKIYRVFEKKQYNFFVSKYKSKHLIPESSVITHYFSETDKKIPSIIEVRIRDGLHKTLLGFLKIKINKYSSASSSSDTFNEKIELDECFKNLKPITDYKELNVTFYGNLKSFNDDYIKYEFRKSIDRDQTRGAEFKQNLFYSPLRIYDIRLERKNNQININAKLLEPIDSLSNFRKFLDNVTFDESIGYDIHEINFIKIKNIDNEESCSRLCIQNSKCSSYSFKKQDKICKLRLGCSIFNGDIDNEYGYPWRRLQIKSEPGYVIGRRMVRHYGSEHLPTNYTLVAINELIKKKFFNLILKKSINDKEIKFNQSNPNKINLNVYLPYFILVIIIISAFVLLLKLKK